MHLISLDQKYQTLCDLGELAYEIDKDECPHFGKGVIYLVLICEIYQFFDLVFMVLISDLDHYRADD